MAKVEPTAGGHKRTLAVPQWEERPANGLSRLGERSRVNTATVSKGFRVHWINVLLNKSKWQDQKDVAQWRASGCSSLRGLGSRSITEGSLTWHRHRCLSSPGGAPGSYLNLQLQRALTDNAVVVRRSSVTSFSTFSLFTPLHVRKKKDGIECALVFFLHTLYEASQRAAPLRFIDTAWPFGSVLQGQVPSPQRALCSGWNCRGFPHNRLCDIDSPKVRHCSPNSTAFICPSSVVCYIQYGM